MCCCRRHDAVSFQRSDCFALVALNSNKQVVGRSTGARASRIGSLLSATPKRPVVLCGLANEGRPCHAGKTNHLGSLLDKEVLVLRSPDRRHFLKRTCAHYWGPFDNVAERLFTPGGSPGERMYARARLEVGSRRSVARSARGAGRRTVGAHNQLPKCGVWLAAAVASRLALRPVPRLLGRRASTKHFTYYSPEDFRAIFPRSASRHAARRRSRAGPGAGRAASSKSMSGGGRRRGWKSRVPGSRPCRPRRRRPGMPDGQVTSCTRRPTSGTTWRRKTRRLHSPCSCPGTRRLRSRRPIACSVW